MKVETQGQQLRAKKDERPAPKSRKWTEVPMEVDGIATTGYLAESGHWIYFTPDNEQWYKLNTTTLNLTEVLVLRSVPKATPKSEEEKKEARRLRRIARKEKKAAANPDPDVAAHEAEQVKEKVRHMRRKANVTTDPDGSA